MKCIDISESRPKEKEMMPESDMEEPRPMQHVCAKVFTVVLRVCQVDGAEYIIETQD